MNRPGKTLPAQHDDVSTPVLFFQDRLNGERWLEPGDAVPPSGVRRRCLLHVSPELPSSLPSYDRHRTLSGVPVVARTIAPAQTATGVVLLAALAPQPAGCRSGAPRRSIVHRQGQQVSQWLPAILADSWEKQTY